MVNVIKTSVMTSTAAPKVKDQEFVSFGLVESAGVNSFTDFIPSKLNESQLNIEREKDDFQNSFICHMIFYAFICVSIVLHIIIDLGLGSFIKKKFFLLMDVFEKTFFEKRHSFS